MEEEEEEGEETREQEEEQRTGTRAQGSARSFIHLQEATRSSWFMHGNHFALWIFSYEMISRELEP